MGITGLLPFLDKSSRRTHISEFTRCTVAIDTYCWLHKGVFSCAEKLSMGQPTDAYVRYCMKFIDMLLSHKIKPILVFDGRHLPAKAETEVKRRENREINRSKAVELMRMGQHAEARNLLRRSIDVTHEMALELIKQCHQMNVDCIVAPYEADAQLAYLNISGIADVVITEDSDLTLFGCKKVFFKMDISGNGLLVDQEKLHLAMGVNSEHFSMNDFRNMCILSGCDYLASLPGIGLNKARKFIKINTDCDIHRALTRLGSYLNMKSLVVTPEYRDAFILAIITFKHQLVFCPLKRQQIRLNPPTPDITNEQLYYAGSETDPDIALQLAYGNRDPFTFTILNNFDPDKLENQMARNNRWEQKTIAFQHTSIWSKEYIIEENRLKKSEKKKDTIWPNTTSNEAIIPTKRIKRANLTKQDNIDDESLNKKKMLCMYKSNEKKDATDTESNLEVNILTPSEHKTSPVLIRRANPFTSQSTSSKTSPSLLTTSRSRIKGRNIMRIRRTILSEETVTESKFFAKVIPETCDVMADDDVCSNTNSSSQKENMEVENITVDNNLKVAVVNSNVEKDSCLMDIDEEHSTSFTLNECKDDEYSTISNCDSGKSHSEVSKYESMINEFDTNEIHNSNILLSPSKDNADSDFLIQQKDIDALNNSVFKWPGAQTSAQTSSKPKKSKSKNSRTLVNNKINVTNRTRWSNETCSVQNQQSLLSMFGFEKKKLIQKNVP